MQAILRVMDQELALECAPHERRRLEDLASTLEARLAGMDGDATHRLMFTALALLDEVQAAGAALARARCEIERLSDMVLEARLEAAGPAPEGDDMLGRVDALRAIHGAA